MNMFTRLQPLSGTVVLELQSDGIAVVSISRARQPQVQFTRFFALAKTDAPTLLKRIHKELKLKHSECIHLLGVNDYQLSAVDAPNVPQEEMKSAVRWLLKDMLDYNSDDATIDVIDIPTRDYTVGRKPMVYAISAHNTLIAERQHWFEEAQIPLEIIDIPDLAQRNIANLIAPDDRGIAVFSLHAAGSILTVSFKGELYLARHFDISLLQLIHATADQKIAIFDKLALELQRSFDHIDRQYPFVDLIKLVLPAPTAIIHELISHLTNNLYIPVEALDLSSIFDISLAPDLQQTDTQARFQLCLGAALRHEDKTL